MATEWTLDSSKMKRPNKGTLRFVTVVYRMPTKPTAGRVAVWRQLKKIGAIYLHQSVCVFPDTARTRRELDPILRKIEQSGGEYHLLPLRMTDAQEYDKLVKEFIDQTARQYQEIIENCEVNFQKEIEFETFRENFTYEEAEEIRIEYEKICRWFDQVRERDWFGAPNADQAAEWLQRSEKLLEQFEAKVYEVQEQLSDGSTLRRAPRRRARVPAPAAPPPYQEISAQPER
jgi:Protein ChrB, N-terminal